MAEQLELLPESVEEENTPDLIDVVVKSVGKRVVLVDAGDFRLQFIRTENGLKTGRWLRNLSDGDKSAQKSVMRLAREAAERAIKESQRGQETAAEREEARKKEQSRMCRIRATVDEQLATEQTVNGFLSHFRESDRPEVFRTLVGMASRGKLYSRKDAGHTVIRHKFKGDRVARKSVLRALEKGARELELKLW